MATSPPTRPGDPPQLQQTRLQRAMLSNAVFAGSRISGASQLAMTNLPETSWLPSTSPPSSPIGSIESGPYRAGKSAGEENLNEIVKPLKEVPPVQVRSGQSRSGRTGSECCRSSGDRRVRSVHSKEAGREDSAPTSDIIATPTPLG